MKSEEKQISQTIQDVTGIGNTSAQAIISVIGTDMERERNTFIVYKIAPAIVATFFSMVVAVIYCKVMGRKCD